MPDTVAAPAPAPMSPAAARGPDVFISYAREDRALAQALAQALEAQGLDVWWDRDIPLGRDFAEVIGENLASAKVICVLWSAPSVQSSFVRDESSRARDAGKLLPIRIADTPLPLGFGTLHTLDMIGWDGTADDPTCEQVVHEIRQAVVDSAQRHGPAARALPDPVARTGRIAGPRRPWAVSAVLLLALAGAGWGGWRAWQDREARFHLGEGLKAQFSPDPNLEAARNEYLFAIAADARLSPAHYYLAHVYAQLDRPGDARTQFLLALQAPAGLDSGQREAAEKLLRTLNASAEPAALPAVARRGDPPYPGGTARAPAAAPSPARPVPGATAGAPATPSAAVAGAAPQTLADQLGRLRALAGQVPPQADQARDVAARVAALFGADAQERLNAATALALTPSLNSDAVGPLIERSLASLQATPSDASTRATVHAALGVLQNASAMSLAWAGEPLQQLLRQAAGLGPQHRQAVDKVARRAADAGRALPRVFIQVAGPAQRSLAAGLARRLRDNGFDVPGIEDVGARAPTRTELRVQGTSHLGLARWQRRQIVDATGEAAVITVLRKADPAVDTYELWLAASLCNDPARPVSGCSGRIE